MFKCRVSGFGELRTFSSTMFCHLYKGSMFLTSCPVVCLYLLLQGHIYTVHLQLPGCVSFPSPSRPHIHCPRTVARLCVFPFSFKATSTPSTYSCPVVCLSLLLQGHIYTVHLQLPGCVSFPSPSRPHLHCPRTVARLCVFPFSFKATSTPSTYSCPVVCLSLLLQGHIYTVHVQLPGCVSFPSPSRPHLHCPLTVASVFLSLLLPSTSIIITVFPSYSSSLFLTCPCHLTFFSELYWIFPRRTDGRTDGPVGPISSCFRSVNHRTRAFICVSGMTHHASYQLAKTHRSIAHIHPNAITKPGRLLLFENCFIVILFTAKLQRGLYFRDCTVIMIDGTTPWLQAQTKWRQLHDAIIIMIVQISY